MSRHARKCVVRCMSGRVDGRTGCSMNRHMNMTNKVFRVCADSASPDWKGKVYGAYGNA